jgi:hypothetical protein
MIKIDKGLAKRFRQRPRISPMRAPRNCDPSILVLADEGPNRGWAVKIECNEECSKLDWVRQAGRIPTPRLEPRGDLPSVSAEMPQSDNYPQFESLVFSAFWLPPNHYPQPHSSHRRLSSSCFVSERDPQSSVAICTRSTATNGHFVPALPPHENVYVRHEGDTISYI